MIELICLIKFSAGSGPDGAWKLVDVIQSRRNVLFRNYQIFFFHKLSSLKVLSVVYRVQKYVGHSTIVVRKGTVPWSDGDLTFLVGTMRNFAVYTKTNLASEERVRWNILRKTVFLIVCNYIMTFGLWTKFFQLGQKFRQCCENWLLRLQRNILRIFWRTYQLFNYLRILSSSFSVFYQ